MAAIFLQGFFLQASLILALGAQNIFVLNSGLKRQRHIFVAFVCSACDALLILIGVLGAATIFTRIPLLKIIFGLLGVIFLFYYGIKKLIESKNDSTINESSVQSIELKKVFFMTLAFSLLNPHVYLDTVVLIGGYSSKFLLNQERLMFGLGASIFSILWFFGLAILASAGNKLIHNHKFMRSISIVSGVILLWLSVKLGIDVQHWIQFEF